MKIYVCMLWTGGGGDLDSLKIAFTSQEEADKWEASHDNEYGHWGYEELELEEKFIPPSEKTEVET